MRGVHKIELPTSVGIHQVGNLLRRVQFFPGDPSRIHVSFHPDWNSFDPLGIAMLAAWGDHCIERGAKFTFENVAAKGVGYAARLGLFKVLPATFKKPLVKHEPAGRFVEVSRIANQAAITALCAEIGGILKVPHLIESVQYVLAEMARNALEHAGAAAYVCAQYYEADKRVTIGIADCGQGVRQSLSSNFGFKSDDVALMAAMKPGVSGATRTMYSAPNNAGLGLYYARGISKASGRQFVLVSGDAAYKQRPRQDGAIPAHDPSHDNHELLRELHPWRGTAVGVNIRGFDGDMRTFMSKMGRSLNVGREIARRPAIRFT